MRKNIEHYEDEIKKYHNELNDYPGSITLQNKLNYRLGKWVSLLDIVVMAANNEQLPYKESEIGFKIKPMPDKKTSGFYNVADYQFFISNYNCFGGLIIERKTTGDFYSSLMRSENRIRLYNEIQRYELDSRFFQMIIMVEGSLQDFLEYSPKFNGNTYNRNHIGANVASRRSTVAGLFARGVPVLWCGSRAQAVKLYPQMVRQWCIKNYAKILNIEDSQ